MTELQEDKQIHKFSAERLAKMSRMPLIVIYAHPADYPNNYVARAWDVDKPTHLIALGDTLEEARTAIPEGMCNLGRFQNDDPCIAEVWI